MTASTSPAASIGSRVGKPTGSTVIRDMSSPAVSAKIGNCAQAPSGGGAPRVRVSRFLGRLDPERFAADHREGRLVVDHHRRDHRRARVLVEEAHQRIDVGEAYGEGAGRDLGDGVEAALTREDRPPAPLRRSGRCRWRRSSRRRAPRISSRARRASRSGPLRGRGRPAWRRRGRWRGGTWGHLLRENGSRSMGGRRNRDQPISGPKMSLPGPVPICRAFRAPMPDPRAGWRRRRPCPRRPDPGGSDWFGGGAPCGSRRR